MIARHREEVAEVPVDDEPRYDDSITLLQEEIARLEDELRMHTESRGPSSVSHEADQELREKLDALTTQLTDRDETILLMFDQVRSLEEALSASREEWEQLDRWVQEVEQRVESTEGIDREKDAQLLVEHENLKKKLRRAEQRRRVLQLEVFRLNGEVGKTSQAPTETFDRAPRADQDEIEALRATIASLRKQLISVPQEFKVEGRSVELNVAGLEALRARNSELEKELVVLRDELGAALRDRATEKHEREVLRVECEGLEKRVKILPGLRKEFDRIKAENIEIEAKLAAALDDAEHQRIEYEASLAAIRADAVAASIVAPSPSSSPSSTLSTGADKSGEMTIEERMSAFRRHLHEVHQREVAERRERKLSTRLSRLWRKTGPKT
jgi:chromosome segregation ATPase